MCHKWDSWWTKLCKNADPLKQIFLDTKGENSFRNLDGECVLMSTFHDAKRYLTFVFFVMLKMTSNFCDLLRATFETFVICGHSHIVMKRYIKVMYCSAILWLHLHSNVTQRYKACVRAHKSTRLTKQSRVHRSTRLTKQLRVYRSTWLTKQSRVHTVEVRSLQNNVKSKFLNRI